MNLIYIKVLFFEYKDTHPVYARYWILRELSHWKEELPPNLGEILAKKGIIPSPVKIDAIELSRLRETAYFTMQAHQEIGRIMGAVLHAKKEEEMEK